jgi:L,D-transpeptidase ErfK/SrfK
MYVLRLCLLALLSIVLAGCGSQPTHLRSVDGKASVDSGSRKSIRFDERPPIVSDRFVLDSPDQQVVGRVQIVRARYDDTFVDIARTYNLGFDELVQANPGVDPWLPGAGTEVILPTQFVLPDAPRIGIVLNVAAKRLFYFPTPEDGEPEIVVTYPIGIGRYDWATPLGETEVVSKATNPVWYVPASIRRESAEAGDPLPATVSPGPDNPLGKHVLGLGMKSYLLHGTNKPAGVGMRVSHGCVRLFPRDMEHLFELVEIGLPVRIVNQPFILGWLDGDLYFEAHPPLIEDTTDWQDLLPSLITAAMIQQPNGQAAVHTSRVQNAAEAQLGLPVPVLKGTRNMRATLRNAMRVINIVTYDHLAAVRLIE